MRKCLFLFFLFSLLGLPLSYGQEETPDAGKIYANEAILYFPQLVDFSLTLDLPASSIREIVLSIQVKEGQIEEIPQNLAEATEQENFTRIDYRWRIQVENAPLLRDEVLYRWRIDYMDGSSEQIAGTFIFDDQRFEWVEDRDPLNKIHILYPEGRFNADSIRSSIMPIYDLMAEQSQEHEPISLAILETKIPWGCDDLIFVADIDGEKEIECNRELVNNIYAAANYKQLSIAPNKALIESMLGSLMAVTWDKKWAGNPVPAWFEYGLQHYYDTVANTAALAIVQAHLRTNDPLNAIRLAPTSAQFESKVWQSQSVSMVLYIADQYGDDRLIEFANALAEMPFEDAFKTFIKQDLDVFISQWGDWVFSQAAVKAHALTPYTTIQITPTPTATLTLPASKTATLSPSPIFTVTATFTRTPIPATATITPLPAGSFNIRPTASVSSNEVTPESDVSSLQVLVMVGAVVLALMILIGVGLSSRKTNDE